MEELLRFLRAYEVWLYVILGVGGLIYLRKFMLAWQELRGAAFGMERASAQSRLNFSASMLVLFISLGIAEFVLVSYIAPAIPGANPLASPTVDLLATPSVTLAAETPVGEIELGTPGAVTPAETPGAEGGCIPDQIMILSPVDGSEISGVVPITGTVNVERFGFYMLEMKRPEETSWLTILAGNEIRQNETLGVWNTSLLSPGFHQLGLIVTDNQGQSFPRCVVQVQIRQEQENP